MNHGLMNLLFFTYFCSSFGESLIPLSEVSLDIEKLIPGTVDKNCDLAMFTSNSTFPFEFKYSKRVMVQTNTFYLTKFCTVLILMNFFEATDVDILFVRTNFVHIQLILLFPKFNFGVKELIEAKDSFRKDILVFRNDGTPIFKKVTLIHCKRHNPSCILKGASLSIGYTRVRPYLKVKGWPETVPGTPIKHFAPLILSRLTMDVNFQKFKGVEGEMLKYLVKQYGIVFYMNAPLSMISGTKLPNGSWTGKYKMLAQGEIDMLAGSVSGTFEKHQIGEYSAPIFYTTFSLCSRSPEPRPNWQAPIKPFPLLGWLLLFLCILIVGPAIWKITKLHSRFSNTSQPEQTVAHITVQAAATLLVEPWLKPPGGPSALIITAWLLVCLILQCIYASNLTAHLSIPNVRNPVQTLEDAVNQEKTVLIYKGGTLDLYMRLSKDPTVQYILKYQAEYVYQGKDMYPSALDNPTVVGTNEVGILRYNVITERKNPANYYFSPKPLLKNFVGWLFKKDHFLIPAINTAILRATESGLLHKWYQDQFVVNVSKIQGGNSTSGVTGPLLLSQSKGIALSIDHLVGILVFWTMGISLSILIFVFEVIYNYLSCKKWIKTAYYM